MNKDKILTLVVAVVQSSLFAYFKTNHSMVSIKKVYIP
jgi:hypothetical protein